MGIRDNLTRFGLGALGVVGNGLVDLSKAKGDSNERTLGGKDEDTVASNPVPTEKPEQDPKSLLWDPFSIVEQLGYKDRPSAITYGTLKAITFKMPIIQAIIQTRVNQVASFCIPQQDRYQMGFRVRTRDHKKEPSTAEKDWIQQCETLLMRTGVTDNPRGRDSFEAFMRKLVWDSLVYDQMCHPMGTQIQTPFGSCNIEDICEGQLVWTHRGRLKSVTEVKRREYTGNLYSLKARGQTLEATKDHPVFVVTNKDARFIKEVEPEWIPASKVEPGMYMVYPKIDLPIDEYDTPWGALDADISFALGLYTANGHEHNGALTITVCENADYEVERLQKIFQKLGYMVVVTPYEDRRAISVRVNSGGDKELSAFFNRCGKGATNKCVPEFILSALTECKDSFLEGYLRGDGCIKSTGATFSTVSRQLFEGLRLLFADIGIYAAKRDIKEGGVIGSGWNNQYGASIAGKSYREFCNRVAIPCTEVQRPREPAIVRGDYFLLKVNSVEYKDVVELPVFNFEVEDDHSYLAEGYVSHNCFEVIPNRKGIPAEWLAVDAATVRLADSASATFNEDESDAVKFVQIYDSMIITEYSQEDLCFGIRNPRSDLRLQGYGLSELEMLIPTITSLLYSWEYNQKFFTQGSAAKGIINFKGAIPERELQNFRKQWYTQIASVENAWRTPITNSEDLQYINMQASARDMEFNAWMDFLIKVACSMYSIDPVEVNFKYGNVGQKSGLHESSNKEKITESKERGLRPLLRFLARCINQHIIWPMNESFEFDFVGLDANTRDDMVNVNQTRVKTTMTIDELRAEDDLEPLPDGKGELILDPTFLQYAMSKEGGGEEGGFGEGGFDEDGDGDDGDVGDDDYEKMLRQYEDDEDDEDEDDEKSDSERAKDKEAKKSLTKSWVVNL